MNRDAIQKWIDALRSGDYKQCKDQLKIGARFCVLGVLCDLHAKETGEEWKQVIDGQEYQYQSYMEEPPPLVELWIGKEFMKKLNSQEIDIMCCNDSGMSFEDLADLIEANVKMIQGGVKLQ